MGSFDCQVRVHEHSTDPSGVWEEMVSGGRQVCDRLEVLGLDTPPREGHVRFVCLADTHCQLDTLLERNMVPGGDVLIHAGDFTMHGGMDEVREFAKNMKKLPHKLKIVIAGNHDRCLDSRRSRHGDVFTDRCCSAAARVSRHCADAASQAREYLRNANCVYLEDGGWMAHGYKIWGSPWSPVYVIDDWAFQLSRGEALLDVWNKIPADTDILVTHGPPLGHGDLTRSGVRAGCVELLSTIQQRVRPLYNIFGHIHEGYGVTTDGTTKYINAANCGLGWMLRNPPVIFDLPLREECGTSKFNFRSLFENL